ncbi:hypothetical protein ACHAWF_001109 [Thalassiosira exigua]
MESLFVTTMPTTAGSRTTPSFSTATAPISQFPSAVSMLTSRMVLLRKISANLTKATRKQLLYAKACWSEAINMSLWPYALRQVACNDYFVPRNDEGLSKLDLFGNLRVSTNLKSIHTFSCPVYVLDSRLASASGKSIKHWDNRARLGLNLGQSPSHACIVSLVLSLASGLVSPQFHCNYDDFFETVNRASSSTISAWKRLASLSDTPRSEREISASNDTPRRSTRLSPNTSASSSPPMGCHPRSVTDNHISYGVGIGMHGRISTVQNQFSSIFRADGR